MGEPPATTENVAVLPAVTVLATGQKVQRGETVEIADEGIAAQLVDQGWEIPKPKATKKPTTPADEATDKEKP